MLIRIVLSWQQKEVHYYNRDESSYKLAESAYPNQPDNRHYLIFLVFKP